MGRDALGANAIPALLLAALLLADTCSGSQSDTAKNTGQGVGVAREFVNRTAVNATRLWRFSFLPFADATADQTPLRQLLGPLLEYPFLLPLPQLRAGTVYRGSAVRVRRFVRNLLSGHRQLKIGVVGGSISWGQGASVIGTTDWFSVLAKWMIKAFPAANITARNGAVPATPSSYMVMCLELSVDPDVDLVLVEYGINDGYEDHIRDNGAVKPLERLLRRLMDLPGRPAVVVVQVPMVGIAMEPGAQGHQPFYLTSEDVDASLCHYYDVPYLSLRTALYRQAAFERREGWRWSNTFTDFHPGDAGFHCMADLVVHLLLRTALDMLVSDPWGGADTARLHAPLPPPMYTGNTPPNSTMCVVGEGFSRLATSASGFSFANEGPPDKPKWGFVADWGGGGPQPTTAGATGDAAAAPPDATAAPPDATAAPLAAAAPAGGLSDGGGMGGVDGVDGAGGWSGPPPRLVVRVDTRRGPSLVAPEAAVPVPVYVLHLRSYERMGRARISCASGCSCEPLEVDAHITRHVSQTYLARVNASQAPDCDIVVTLLPATSSGGRRFKVSGIVVCEQSGEGATVLDRMSEPGGYFLVGRFHTGDLPMAVYDRASVRQNEGNGTSSG